MRYYWLLAVLFVFISCKNQPKNTISDEEIEKRKQEKLDSIVEVKFSEINKNEVDSYPLFKDSCADSLSKDQQRACFEDSFKKFFQENLKKEAFEVLEPLVDTIFIDVKVDNSGKFSLEKVTAKDKIKQLLATPEQSFEEILTDNLDEVANTYKVTPATKQGVNVSTQFTLPIVVNVK